MLRVYIPLVDPATYVRFFLSFFFSLVVQLILYLSNQQRMRFTQVAIVNEVWIDAYLSPLGVVSPSL